MMTHVSGGCSTLERVVQREGRRTKICDHLNYEIYRSVYQVYINYVRTEI